MEDELEPRLPLHAAYVDELDLASLHQQSLDQVRRRSGAKSLRYLLRDAFEPALAALRRQRATDYGEEDERRVFDFCPRWTGSVRIWIFADGRLRRVRVHRALFDLLYAYANEEDRAVMTWSMALNRLLLFACADELEERAASELPAPPPPPRYVPPVALDPLPPGELRAALEALLDRLRYRPAR